MLHEALGHGSEGRVQTADEVATIDPISAYLGAHDSHKNAEVRGLLAPLADLAARHRVAVVAVTHLRKGDGPAMYRSIGSLAFVAAARSVWAVSKDKADDARRLLLPIKCNIAPDLTGLAYRIISRQAGPVVQWESDPISISADDALGADDPDGGALAEATAWLGHVLADGAAPGADVKRQAKADGIAPRTLDRAKRKLGIVCRPDGFGGPWLWEFPSSNGQSAPDSPHCATPETLAHTGETGADCDLDG